MQLFPFRVVREHTRTNNRWGWQRPRLPLITISITSFTIMSPKTSKRRGVSGIGDEDTLTRVYQGLKEMSATFEYNDVPEDQPLSSEADIAQRIAVLMEMIQLKMDGIKVHIRYLCLLLPLFSPALDNLFL